MLQTRAKRRILGKAVRRSALTELTYGVGPRRKKRTGMWLTEKKEEFGILEKINIRNVIFERKNTYGISYKQKPKVQAKA